MHKSRALPFPRPGIPSLSRLSSPLHLTALSTYPFALLLLICRLSCPLPCNSFESQEPWSLLFPLRPAHGWARGTNTGSRAFFSQDGCRDGIETESHGGEKHFKGIQPMVYVLNGRLVLALRHWNF